MEITKNLVKDQILFFALSKSLLQIAENKSRNINAMRVSQEAQAEAYREISRTKKMRDDDTLFHSIEVYNETNPAKLEKWMEQHQSSYLHYRKGFEEGTIEKVRWCCREITLSMMEGCWSDDEIITKLHQDFSYLSTMNRSQRGVEVPI